MSAFEGVSHAINIEGHDRDVRHDNEEEKELGHLVFFFSLLLFFFFTVKLAKVRESSMSESEKSLLF